MQSEPQLHELVEALVVEAAKHGATAEVVSIHPETFAERYKDHDLMAIPDGLVVQLNRECPKGAVYVGASTPPPPPPELLGADVIH